MPGGSHDRQPLRGVGHPTSDRADRRERGKRTSWRVGRERPSQMSESELLERASAGEAEAIRVLYRRYAPRVYAVVRRILGDEDLAQDSAQEAWVRAIRALPSFRGEARFSTWIHRIAVNAALQLLRRHETLRRREGEGLPEEAPLPPPPGDVLLEARLEQALACLPPGMRQVLILHDVEGYTHEEIAELLGVTPGTSKSQLFKARARMRQLLRPALVEGPMEGEEREVWGI